MQRSAMLLLGACLATFLPQAFCQVPGSPVAQAAPQPEDDALTTADRLKRDDLLAAGIARLKADDPSGAYAAFGPALRAFPNDLRVLRYAGQAALQSHQDVVALDLYTRALATHPHQPWPPRLGRMAAEAHLERWPEFDLDLEALRAAKTAADPQLASSSGFIIEEFEADGVPVQAIVLPAMASRFHTLYRFVLPQTSPAAPPIQASANAPNANDRCNQPDFRPYLDLESDDVDQGIFQKSHPELAAKGGRGFSLDTYPAPCSQGLIRFYDGEPSYEDLRAAVIKALAKSKAAAQK